MNKQHKISIQPYHHETLIGVKSIRLSWGESDTSLGSFVIAKLPEELVNYPVEDQRGLIKLLQRNTDIKYIIRAVKDIYKDEELNGYIEIYQFNSETVTTMLSDDLLSNPVELIVSAKELSVHPWICICWGNRGVEVQKHLWTNHIRESGILQFGKKEASFNFKRLNSTAVLRYITEQYRAATKLGSITNIVEFPVSATKSNILVPRTITRDLYDYYSSDWNFSLENPEDIVNGFSHLSVKEGFKLRAYQFSSEMAGEGVIYAIPSNSRLPKISKVYVLNNEAAPGPEDALEDFMEAIAGDRSPLSYLQAAICYHKLHDFGYYWDNWAQDRILPEVENHSDSHRFVVTSVAELVEQGMQFNIKDFPESLFPRFYYEDNKPVITFYTFNDVEYEKFIRYKHVFPKDGYTQEVIREVLGYGRLGKIF
jgi:hypothetical protein